MRYKKEVCYWIFMQIVIGAGSGLILPILDRYKTAKAFYNAGTKNVKESGLLSYKRLDRYRRASIDNAYRVMERCSQLGYDIITPDDERYPKRLMHISNPPAVLYVNGEMPDFDDEVAISMVGTRKCSETGRSIARELSCRLTKAGALIVSGGAVGIDSSSHIGALRAGGKTVAVLGCGLNYPYLVTNEKLRKDISQHGALISEYPPDAPASKFTFPVRNRIISGLSLGVIVVEATRSSGSLITVDHALEQGRDVFVIPGEISNPLYAGSNRLIRDGAKAVISPMDVLSEYNNDYPHRINMENMSEPISCSDPPTEEMLDISDKVGFTETVGQYTDESSHINDNTISNDDIEDAKHQECNSSKDGPAADDDVSMLSDTALQLLNLFRETNREYLDDVVSGSGISSSDAIAALTELEIFGLIKACPGGRYTLI